jgi:hypothetical protein
MSITAIVEQLPAAVETAPDYTAAWIGFWATFVPGLLAVGGAIWIGLRQSGIQREQTAIQGRQADIQHRQTDIQERQANILERQTALQELTLKKELFERRFQYIEKMRKYVQRMRSGDDLTADETNQFLLDTREAGLLFPKDLDALMSFVIIAAEDYRDLDSDRHDADPKTREAAIDERVKLKQEMASHFSELVKGADQYMRLV